VIDPLFLADGIHGCGMNIQFSGGFPMDFRWISDGFPMDFIEYCGK
jgi:hypothetical protein